MVIFLVELLMASEWAKGPPTTSGSVKGLHISLRLIRGLPIILELEKGNSGKMGGGKECHTTLALGDKSCLNL